MTDKQPADRDRSEQRSGVGSKPIHPIVALWLMNIQFRNLARPTRWRNTPGRKDNDEASVQ